MPRSVTPFILFRVLAQIILHIALLSFGPLAFIAIARSSKFSSHCLKVFESADIVHQNVRLLHASLALHYALFVYLRFVVIYYELNDLPVTSESHNHINHTIILIKLYLFFIFFLQKMTCSFM